MSLEKPQVSLKKSELLHAKLSRFTLQMIATPYFKTCEAVYHFHNFIQTFQSVIASWEVEVFNSVLRLALI